MLRQLVSRSQRVLNRSANTTSKQQRNFSSGHNVSKEQLIKDEAQAKLWTYMTVPVLAGGSFFVIKAHNSHHTGHHDDEEEEKPDMPYLHVMEKAFPWKNGDKCTLFDPHCSERLETE